MGSVPNADHDLLCSLNENSLICLSCSTETPLTNAFPIAPSDTTPTIFMYLHAVRGLFQKTRSIMEERSSPLKVLVITPPERKYASRSQPSRLPHAHGVSERASFSLPTWAPSRLPIPHGLAPLEIEEKPTEIREPKDALYERTAELVTALRGLKSHRKQGQVPCKHYAGIRIGCALQACSQQGHDGV